MEKNRKVLYTITVNVEYNDGTQMSYVTRITPDEEFAKSLMQSIYDDAENKRSTKVGVYSNPEWVDENHNVLKVLCTCGVGYMSVEFPHTYTLNAEWEDNVFSKQTWVLD